MNSRPIYVDILLTALRRTHGDDLLLSALEGFGRGNSSPLILYTNLLNNLRAEIQGHKIDYRYYSLMKHWCSPRVKRPSQLLYLLLLLKKVRHIESCLDRDVFLGLSRYSYDDSYVCLAREQTPPYPVRPWSFADDLSCVETFFAPDSYLLTAKWAERPFLVDAHLLSRITPRGSSLEVECSIPAQPSFSLGDHKLRRNRFVLRGTGSSPRLELSPNFTQDVLQDMSRGNSASPAVVWSVVHRDSSLDADMEASMTMRIVNSMHFLSRDHTIASEHSDTPKSSALAAGNSNESLVLAPTEGQAYLGTRPSSLKAPHSVVDGVHCARKRRFILSTAQNTTSAYSSSRTSKALPFKRDVLLAQKAHLVEDVAVSPAGTATFDNIMATAMDFYDGLITVDKYEAPLKEPTPLIDSSAFHVRPKSNDTHVYERAWDTCDGNSRTDTLGTPVKSAAVFFTGRDDTSQFATPIIFAAQEMPSSALNTSQEYSDGCQASAERFRRESLTGSHLSGNLIFEELQMGNLTNQEDGSLSHVDAAMEVLEPWKAGGHSGNLPCTDVHSSSKHFVFALDEQQDNTKNALDYSYSNSHKVLHTKTTSEYGTFEVLRNVRQHDRYQHSLGKEAFLVLHGQPMNIPNVVTLKAKRHFTVSVPAPSHPMQKDTHSYTKRVSEVPRSSQPDANYRKVSNSVSGPLSPKEDKTLHIESLKDIEGLRKALAAYDYLFKKQNLTHHPSTPSISRSKSDPRNNHRRDTECLLTPNQNRGEQSIYQRLKNDVRSILLHRSQDNIERRTLGDYYSRLPTTKDHAVRYQPSNGNNNRELYRHLRLLCVFGANVKKLEECCSQKEAWVPDTMANTDVSTDPAYKKPLRETSKKEFAPVTKRVQNDSAYVKRGDVPSILHAISSAPHSILQNSHGTTDTLTWNQTLVRSSVGNNDIFSKHRLFCADIASNQSAVPKQTSESISRNRENAHIPGVADIRSSSDRYLSLPKQSTNDQTGKYIPAQRKQPHHCPINEHGNLHTDDQKYARLHKAFSEATKTEQDVKDSLTQIVKRVSQVPHQPIISMPHKHRERLPVSLATSDQDLPPPHLGANKNHRSRSSTPVGLPNEAVKFLRSLRAKRFSKGQLSI